jgi:glycerophosphoryl diester phosphodiesterase
VTGWRRRNAGPPLVIGHRGASAHALENTLAAFRRARADGADGVELDVVGCKTGEVAVFHDDDLQRLAGRPERIEDLPLAALREVRLGGGETIPLLEEVFEDLGPLLVNVELKAPRALSARTTALVRRVAALIERHALGDRALVSSFNPVALAQFRKTAPRVATGLLFGAEQKRPLREAWSRRFVRPAAMHPENLLVDATRMGSWRSEGYLVNVWTVDDEAEVKRLARLGVDGIITNDPARVRGALPAP